MDDAPLILTLRLDEASFARFDAERRLHFPPARNHIGAHLTLFHHLPSNWRGEIMDGLASVAAGQAPFHLVVSSLRYLGQGTAYVIDSPELHRLRAEIAGRWSAHLIRQDAQSFRPHVTIQNKTAAATAKAVFEELSTSFVPFGHGDGLAALAISRRTLGACGRAPFHWLSVRSRKRAARNRDRASLLTCIGRSR